MNSARVGAPLNGRMVYTRRAQTKRSLRARCPVCNSLPNEPCRAVGRIVEGATRKPARYIGGKLHIIGRILPRAHSERTGVL